MSIQRWRRAPARSLTPELGWVLHRAFVSRRAAVGENPALERRVRLDAEGIDGSRAAGLARDLGLAERINSLVGPVALAAELGREPARELAVACSQRLARTQRQSEFVPELAEAARATSISIVLLKFAALRAGGYLVEGSRAAADLDILVRDRDAAAAAAMLSRRGFFPVHTPDADHHLPPLQDPMGRVVEIHTSVPGLRMPGSRRFAGFQDLCEAGVLNPAPGLAEGCFLPRPDLLAVHAIVHGFAHHGGADAYPLTRTLADVIDILPGPRRGCRLEAARWIADDVPADDLEAILGLCDALTCGDLDPVVTDPRRSAECALLYHVLASALDAEYRRSLTLRYLFDWMSDQPPWRRALTMLRSRVLPTDAQLAARLGLPGANSVHYRHRLAHVAMLARRLPEFARPALLLWRRRGPPRAGDDRRS